MGVADNNAVYGDNARFTHNTLSIYQHITLISQTALELWTHTPGYAFQIIALEVYCMSLAGTSSFDLHIGAVSALSAVLTPVALIHTAAAINTDGTEYGDDDDIISILYTSDGSGVVNASTFQLTLRRRAQDIS